MKTINRWDVGSVESSDTYASCNTQPFASQGDLTQEETHNLYINPLDDHHQRSFQSPPGRVAAVVSSANGSPVHHHHVVVRRPPLSKTLSSSSTDSGSMDDAKTTSPSHSPHKKPRFMHGIRHRPRFDSTSTNPSPANKPRTGIKTPFPNLASFFLPGKSVSKTSLHSEVSDTRKSPDVSKKKSILKKGDSLHKEETEKLIPDQPTKNASSEEVNVACLQSNGTANRPSYCGSMPSSSNKQPLKAIGPKIGTKPPAQPIKFVGIVTDNKSPRNLPHQLQLLEPLSSDRKLSYQGTGSFDFGRTEPQQDDGLCCANKSCAYNQVAQSYLSAVVCLCGSQMEGQCGSVAAENNPTGEMVSSKTGGDVEDHSGSSSPTEETKLLAGDDEQQQIIPNKMSRQSSKESPVLT